MNFQSKKDQLIETLADKENRDAFVAEHIDTGDPFQLRALREQREWTQDQVGQEAGMAQARISVLEDPNYASFTLKSLKKLASAFDVALIVRFVPFSQLINWDLTLSPESLKAESFNEEFEKEIALKPSVGSSILDRLQYHPTQVVDIELYRGRKQRISALTPPISGNVINHPAALEATKITGQATG